MEAVYSVMLDRLLGTLLLSVSRTMYSLCLTLVTGSNISPSRPTSRLLSAFALTHHVKFLFTYLYLHTFLEAVAHARWYYGRWLMWS